MTKQEVFTKVATHLLKQNEKSLALNDIGASRYRGANGLRCAIGILIADEHYDAALLEGRLASTEPVVDALRLSGVSRVAVEFLLELQDVHDEHQPRYWRQRLTEVAYEHGLEMP